MPGTHFFSYGTIGGPLSLVAPTVTGNLTNGSTLTTTNGTWSGSPTGYTYQWQRDGVDISGQTASTYTYTSATDDGRYISVNVTATNASGSNTATSNVRIIGESSVFYSTSFVGADNTAIVGYESWAGVGFNAAIKAYILSNQFAVTSSINGLQYTHVANANDHEIEVPISYVTSGVNNTNSTRSLFARYTDANNYVLLSWNNGGWSVARRVAGVNTSLQAGGTGPGVVNGDTIKLRVSGNYARVYRNGVETSQSAAANGGLGYDITAVPASSKIALGAGDGSGLPSYPYTVFTDATIYNILTDEIVISTIAVESASGIPGEQEIRLTGSIAGSVTQLQALVLSAAGEVLLDWADVSGLSGSTFNSVTATLPQEAEGQTVTVWLRDKTNKKTATSSTVAVEVQAQVVSLSVGMNASGINPTGELVADLMRMCSLYTTKGGTYRNVYSPEATVVGAVSYVDATDLGLDANYFPTKFPDAAGYSGTEVPFWLWAFASGAPAELQGTYDVTFTPGMRWTLSGGTVMTRSNYNEAAGTATITVTSNTGTNPELSLNGYDNGGGYVARTLPPAGAGYLRMARQGQASGKSFRPATITSLGGVTSSTGYIRWMDAMRTNRGAIAGVTYNARTARRPVTAMGLLAAAESISLEEILEAAIDTGCNPWICIADTASPDYVLDVATYLFNNMPDGMKAAIEYSNEMWNFGVGFSQSSALNDRATAAGVTSLVQYSREFKTKVLDVFESVFGVNSDRLHPVFCWQSTISESQLASMLDEGNIYQKIKGFGIAPYVGGGIGTGADQGNYSTQTIFTGPQRDLILTDEAAFKTAFFAATTTMSDLSKGVWLNFVNMLAQYCVSKGLARTAIRPAAYEYMWQHIVERNTPTAASQDVLTREAFAEILRDSRAGDQQDYQNNWLKATGGDVVAFSHLNPAGTSISPFGSWGFYDNISDTTSEPGVSQVAWITANT